MSNIRKEPKPYSVHLPDSIDWDGFEKFYNRAIYLKIESEQGINKRISQEWQSTYRNLLRTIFNNHIAEDSVKYDFLFGKQPDFQNHAGSLFVKLNSNELKMLQFFDSEGRTFIQ